MNRISRITLCALVTGVVVFAFIRFHDQLLGAPRLAKFLEHTLLPIAGFGASAYLALGLRGPDRDS